MIVREFYPLMTLAERWGCTVSELLHLGIQGELQICVNIYGMASGQRRLRICLDDTDSEPGVEPESEEEREESAQIAAAYDAWLSRTTRDMPFGIFELDYASLRFIDMPDGLPFELFEARKFDNGGWWDVTFDPPVMIKQEHLCMLHEEVIGIDKMGLEKMRLATSVGGVVSASDPGQAYRDTLSKLGRLAADIRHSKPGGSREKRQMMIDIWMSGKYTSRDICAEQECDALGMSFSAARKALRGTPDPS